jgi:hypothetical protein
MSKLKNLYLSNREPIWKTISTMSLVAKRSSKLDLILVYFMNFFSSVIARLLSLISQIIHYLDVELFFTDVKLHDTELLWNDIMS